MPALMKGSVAAPAESKSTTAAAIHRRLGMLGIVLGSAWISNARDNTVAPRERNP
jgi:hypothetical protein